MDLFNTRRASCSKGAEARRNRTSDGDHLLNSAPADDSHSPAYSSTQEDNHIVGDSATCCALLNFNLAVRGVSKYDCLLEQYQRLAFLFWVAFDRRPAQNIPNLERLSCPLLWCRKSFDDHDKLVNHVSTCSYLEQGEYWCLYHQQSERFSTNHHRKHFFKGAVTAIRKLGSKSMLKVIHPSKPRTSRDVPWPKEHRVPGYKHDEDVAEMDEGDIRELDGGVSESMATGPLRGCRQEAFAGYLPAEMEDVRSSAAKLASNNLSCPPMELESTGVLSPDSALSPVSPISPADQWQARSYNDFPSPISPTDDTAPIPWAINPMLLTKVDHQVHEKQDSYSSYQASKFGSSGFLSNIHIDTSFANLMAYMWEAPAERSTGNSISRHKVTAVYDNFNQTPPTSRITEDHLRPPSTLNNLQSSKPSSNPFGHSCPPTYHHQEFNQPAMESFEHPQMKVLRETVTGPLITRQGLEGFIPVVQELHLGLFAVWKVTIGELQLKLLQAGIMQAQSRHLCDVYIGTVLDLCNQALTILGDKYLMEDLIEDQHYAQQITILLQQYHEQQPAGYEMNAPEVDHNPDASPYTSPYATNGTSPSCEMPVAAGSSEVYDNFWVHPDQTTTTGPFTSATVSPQDGHKIPQMPEPDHNPHGHTTDHTLPQVEIHPPRRKAPSRSDPLAPISELVCNECGKVLRGKETWLVSNLQRHKREKHSGQAVLFPCPVDGCGKVFSRKHNLKTHTNTVHKDLVDQ